MTATHTKSQCARPSHTQHSFLGNSWHRKGTASKHDPEIITCSLTTHLGPIAQTTGSFCHSHHMGTRPTPKDQEKNNTGIQAKKYHVCFQTRSGLGRVRERERDRWGFRGFSDTEVHPWNGSRSSKPPWTNLVVLLGERSKPQSRTLLFGFLLQRTSARRKLLTWLLSPEKPFELFYSITKQQLTS